MPSSSRTIWIRWRRWPGSSSASSGSASLVRVNDLLGSRAAEMPRKTALVCGGERYTYGQLDVAARRFADLLRDRDVIPGERVAICLDNSADAVVAIFGALHAGAVFFVVNPQARLDYRNQLIR